MSCSVRNYIQASEIMIEIPGIMSRRIIVLRYISVVVDTPFWHPQEQYKITNISNPLL